MRGLMALAVVLLMCIGSSTAQVNGDTGLQVREDDGGNVVVHTANGLINQNSSLKRKWYAIDDPSSPVRLNRTGVYNRFDTKEQIQLLLPFGTVSPKQAISAIEVRYVLFDIWGQRLRTLTLTRLADSSTNIDLKEGAAWPAWENEVSQLLTVVSFAARVRTAEGQVWTYNPDAMMAQIEALGLSVAKRELIPDEPMAIDQRVLYSLRPKGATPAGQ